MKFCSKCKYFESTKGYLTHFDYCRHPNNLSYSCDWKNKWRMSIKHPRKINKKNDCKWYEN